jgi:hypothetical protein
MEWHNFINVSLENLLLFGTNYQVAQENWDIWVDCWNHLGRHQKLVHSSSHTH